jgi:hypothetical protein
MSNLEPKNSLAVPATRNQVAAHSTPIDAGQGQQDMYNENQRTRGDLSFQGTGEGWALNGAGLPLFPPIARDFSSFPRRKKLDMYFEYHVPHIPVDYLFPQDFDPESLETPLPSAAAKKPPPIPPTREEVTFMTSAYKLPPINQSLSSNTNRTTSTPYHYSSHANHQISSNIPQTEIPHQSRSAHTGCRPVGYGGVPMERSYPNTRLSAVGFPETIDLLNPNAQKPPSDLPILEYLQLSNPAPTGFESHRLGGYEMERSFARRSSLGRREPDLGQHARQPVGYITNDNTALLNQRERTDVAQFPRNPGFFDPVRSCMPPPESPQYH